MSGITDLLKSERGIIAILTLLAATVLTAIGTLPVDGWKELVQWLLVVYIGGKSLTGVAVAIANRPSNPTVAVTPPSSTAGGVTVVTPDPTPLITTAST